jgi:hypothetical protein
VHQHHKVNRKSGGAQWRDLRRAARPSQIPRGVVFSLRSQPVLFLQLSQESEVDCVGHCLITSVVGMQMVF